MPEHDLKEKPDAGLIDQYRTHLQEVWSNAHSKWESVYDAYYFRTYQVWEGKEAEERPDWLKPARPTSIVDHAVDHQLSAEPHVHRFPVGEDEAHQVNADLTEKALTAILEEAALLEPVLTWKLLNKHLVLYGYAIHELGLDSHVLSRRSEEPEKEAGESDEDFEARQRLYQHYRRTAMPFRTRVPHPSDVLLDPTEKQPRIAVKHTQRYSLHLHEMTLARKKRGRAADLWEMGKNPWELILVDEFWSEYWHAVMASGRVGRRGGRHSYNEGQLLFVEPNTWGFVPYAHAFANFGMEKTGVNSRDPSDLAVSILDPVIADLRAQAQAVSGRHNALMDATFNPIGTRIPAEELRNQLDQGNIIEMQEKGDVWRMEIPQLPRWMFMTEEWLSRDIEEGTVSRALSGIREQGVSTVGQQAILSTAAGRKFVGVAKQAEHIASVVCSQILQLVDILDLDLTVRGNRIKPDYIDKDYSVHVTFDVVDPVLQLQDRQQSLREVELGLKSMETYWAADAKLEDASGEQRRLLADWIRANPLVHQALAMEVAKGMGLETLLQRAMALAAASGEQGQNPPEADGGIPSNGAAPPELLGPDGQPLSQSMGQTGGAPRAVEQLREGLTSDVFNPARRGNNRAG